MKKTCTSCVHFVAHPGRAFIDKSGASVTPGACHRFPPQVVIKVEGDSDQEMYDTIKALFPNVLPFQHCGEHDDGSDGVEDVVDVRDYGIDAEVATDAKRLVNLKINNSLTWAAMSRDIYVRTGFELSESTLSGASTGERPLPANYKAMLRVAFPDAGFSDGPVWTS